jgi:hypothetical protein
MSIRRQRGKDGKDASMYVQVGNAKKQLATQTCQGEKEEGVPRRATQAQRKGGARSCNAQEWKEEKGEDEQESWEDRRRLQQEDTRP